MLLLSLRFAENVFFNVSSCFKLKSDGGFEPKVSIFSHDDIGLIRDFLTSIVRSMEQKNHIGVLLDFSGFGTLRKIRGDLGIECCTTPKLSERNNRNI